MLASILTIIAPLVPTILANAQIIGPGTASLIANLLGPVQTLISGIMSGTTKTEDALAVLAALSGTIQVLKQNTSLSPATLTEINGIDQDIQKALGQYALAQGGYNASLYTQIAPVA
jgi:hypothetical protein